MTPEQEKQWVREWIMEGIGRFIADAATDPNAFVTAVCGTRRPNGPQLHEPVTVVITGIPDGQFEAAIIKVIADTGAIAFFTACVTEDGEVSIITESRSDSQCWLWSGKLGDSQVALAREMAPRTFFTPKVLN